MGKPRALFVGANAEEYGSDRMLLQSIEAVRDVVDPWVLLPRPGPLVDRLVDADVPALVCGDYALRRGCLSPRGISSLLSHNLSAVARVVPLHRRRPFDLVYSNTQTVVVGALIARLLRAQHVWHVHEIFREPPRLARALARLVAWSGGQVVACSDRVRSSLTELAPRISGRIDVVHNGIEVDDTILDYAPADDVVRIGCVARLHARKGQELLLRAVALLDERVPHIGKTLEVHLFGSPFSGHEHVLERVLDVARERGLQDRLHVHGFVSDPAHIYPNIDVLVLPSTEPESFGIVCLEAMAFGRPVIAPAEGGPPEFIESGLNGVLFEPRDEVSLADAIERVVGDPTFARAIALRGRRAVEARYTGKRYRDAIRDLVVRTCGLEG
jgi:glycosyltransferase involved in cell wall biosynthesis